MAMELASRLSDLRRLRHELLLGRSARLGRRPRLGFVPTMGALHAGHASLIRQMVAQCDVSAVSIFVNPRQFGPGEDLSRYPRPLEDDLELCAECGVELVFTPDPAEVYPPGFQTQVRLPALAERWCGASRPGHFDGVATVVLKLLELLRPDCAYFGEKDFQQLRLITQMVLDLGIETEITPSPTLREADGLALSSRNSYLSAAERSSAPQLHAALQAARGSFSAGERDPAVIEAVGRALLEYPGSPWQLDYFALVDSASLEPVTAARNGQRLLAAARLGQTRLIDNIALGAEGQPQSGEER